MNKGDKKGVTPAIVVLILALVAIGLVVVGFPNLTGRVMFNGVDYTDPIIISAPADGSIFASVDDVTEMTWEFNPANDPVIDPAVDVSSCEYSINGVDRVAIDCSADTTISGLVASEGENTWTVYATDNEDPGNTIEVSTTFTIGAASPDMFAGDVPMDEVVTINYPVDGEEYEVPPQVLEYTLHENIDVANDLISCEYKASSPLDLGTKERFSCVAPLSITTFDQGLNTWTLYIKDKFGNEKIEPVSFTFTYTPDLSAPYSWTTNGEDFSRDRYSDHVQVVPSNLSNDFLIQPSIYGKILANTGRDNIITSKGYAYVTTDTNKLLKISVDSGAVEGILDLAVSPMLLINSGRDLIYGIAKNLRTVYIINISDMTVIDEVASPNTIVSKTSPVIKENKIFYVSGSGIEVFEFATPYDIEHSETIGTAPKVGLTDIPGTELIALMEEQNKIYLVNTTINADEGHSGKIIDANCTKPLSDIISKGTKLYYMCEDYDGIIVEIDASNFSGIIKKSIYGVDASVNRLKNSHKTAFAVNNEWAYYGTNDGITAVLLSNLGAADVAGNPIRRSMGEVTSIAVSGDTVYATNSIGTLYFLDPNNVSDAKEIINLDNIGATPRLFNTIFASDNTLLVLGKDNYLYKFPKTGIEIEFVAAAVAENEWITQGGQQTRTRYINTSAVETSKFKRIAFNPIVDDFIKIDKNTDTVLTYQGYAYSQTNNDKINKIDLSTGKVISTSANKFANFFINPLVNKIYGIHSNIHYLLSLDLSSWTESASPNYAVGRTDHSWKCGSCGCPNDYCNVHSAFFRRFAYPIAMWKTTTIAFTNEWRWEQRRHQMHCPGGCTRDWTRHYYKTVMLEFPPILGGGPHYSAELAQIFGYGLDLPWDSGKYFHFDAGGYAPGLAEPGRVAVSRISEVERSNNIVMSVLDNFIFATMGDDRPSSLNIISFGGGYIGSQIISKKDRLYYIMNDGVTFRIYKIGTGVEHTISLPTTLNANNAFALDNERIYIGLSSESENVLIYKVINPLAPVVSISVNGKPTTITSVNDVVYVGTDTGWIYTLDKEKLDDASNSIDDVTKWSVKATTATEDQAITSIIIPGEGSMLAVGGTNSLFLFGEAIELTGPAYCGNGFCEEDAGETCYDEDAETGCIDCIPCGLLNEEDPNSEDDTRSGFPKTNCRRNIDGESLWRDTEENSENDCKRGDETCCPWGQVCKFFSGLSSDEEGSEEIGQWKCIFDGVTTGCSSYTTPESCQAFEMFAAFESVELAQGPGFCGSFSDTGAYYDCQCVWDTETNSCQPGWELVDIQPDGTRDVQESCQLTCDDGECIGGIKTVTCSALGSPEGVCSGTETQAGCAIPTEVPFFTLMNALVAVGILAGFYILTRKN